MGPGDLSLSLGYRTMPQPWPEQMQETHERVKAACRQNGVAFLDGAAPETVAAKIDAGARVFSGGNEETAGRGERTRGERCRRSMTGNEKTLRSAAWFGDEWHQGFVSRGWTKNQGHPEQMFDGRPVIGICNTWSDLNPCNAHLRILAEQVKRGVYEAGGFPLEFPVTSLGETLMKPTTMLYRNLASMDVEESIRANPLDGVVLLTGCDKTTPACLMGAASVDLPTIAVTGGPMLNGKFRNQNIGSGTDVYRFTTELRAGSISRLDYLEAEAGISRSDGHCMTMGTASTMACMVEAVGLTLPSGAAIPGPDARRKRLGHLAGNRIVEMVREGLAHVAHPDAASHRKRHQGQRSTGRLDQLRGASVGHCRTARRRIGFGRLRPLGQPHAALGQSNALG